MYVTIIHVTFTFDEIIKYANLKSKRKINQSIVHTEERSQNLCFNTRASTANNQTHTNQAMKKGSRPG